MTTERTSALAHSAGQPLGTAVRVVRIMPVEYSPVMTSTPRTATTSLARSAPVSHDGGVVQQRDEDGRVLGFRGRVVGLTAVKKTAR